MRKMALACGLVMAVTGLASASDKSGEIELIVAGPPIEAKETADEGIYLEPSVPPQYRHNGAAGGLLAQGWSMLGREDLSADLDPSEYAANTCDVAPSDASGMDAVLARIEQAARNTRIVIVNESHVNTQHRDFSRAIIEHLRPRGFTVLAAETFRNRLEEIDPVESNAALPYPSLDEGTYSDEPVFGELVRTAKRLGYRLAAYEQVGHPPADSIDEQIARREQAQAENLAALLKTMRPEEKLIVHVGYAHARESIEVDATGFEHAWMAARLKRMTGIDPLTVAQTICRGTGDAVQIFASPESLKDQFDLLVDHPPFAVRHGRAAWRFAGGAQPVDIPAELQPSDTPLIIEAFAEGEPFDAVPVDRVWVEPGEDIKLVLKPGRYVVRAVRPAKLPS